MIAQLMTRQKEFMKEIGARMDRLEVEKVKKTQVENLDDEDKPIWDKDDRIDHERKKNTIADKIVAETLKMKRKWSHVKMVLFPWHKKDWCMGRTHKSFCDAILLQHYKWCDAERSRDY